MNNAILPAHILRLYSWEILKLNTDIWAPTGINGLIPIVPIEDEPKLSDSGQSYMIYGYSENERLKSEIRRGNFAMRVIGKTWGELGEIVNTIALAFENCDASAEAVNLWSSEFSTDGVRKPFIGIRFTNIDLSYIEGGEAGDTEGGPSEGLVNISYKYITHQTITLPAASQGGLWNSPTS